MNHIQAGLYDGSGAVRNVSIRTAGKRSVLPDNRQDQAARLSLDGDLFAGVHAVSLTDEEASAVEGEGLWGGIFGFFIGAGVGDLAGGTVGGFFGGSTGKSIGSGVCGFPGGLVGCVPGAFL